jgi:hypothetical protein
MRPRPRALGAIASSCRPGRSSPPGGRRCRCRRAGAGRRGYRGRGSAGSRGPAWPSRPLVLAGRRVGQRIDRPVDLVEAHAGLDDEADVVVGVRPVEDELVALVDDQPLERNQLPGADGAEVVGINIARDGGAGIGRPGTRASARARQRAPSRQRPAAGRPEWRGLQGRPPAPSTAPASTRDQHPPLPAGLALEEAAHPGR